MYCLLVNYSKFWMQKTILGEGLNILECSHLKFCQTCTTKSIQKPAYSVEFDSVCEVWSRSDCSGAFILNNLVFYIGIQAFWKQLNLISYEDSNA